MILLLVLVIVAMKVIVRAYGLWVIALVLHAERVIASGLSVGAAFLIALITVIVFPAININRNRS